MDFRKKIGIFVLVGATLLAGFLIFSPSAEPGVGNVQADATKVKAEPFQLEKENEKIGIVTNDDLATLFNGQNGQAKTKNLTQQLADDLAKGFVDKNPNGVDTQGGWLTPDNEDLLQQNVAAAAKEFQVENQTVELHELNISSNNSVQNISDYISQYYGIVNSYGVKMKLADNLEAFSDGQNTAYVTPLIDQLAELIGALKELSVPSDFVVFHQKEINLLNVEKSFLTALANYSEDPLRAVAALQMLPDLEKHFVSLDDSIEQQLKAYGFEVVRE